MSPTPKLYTFSLWNTLLEHSPLFEAKRNEAFRKVLAPAQSPLAFAKAFTAVQRTVDALEQQSGLPYSFASRLQLTCGALLTSAPSAEELAHLAEEQARLLLQHLPPTPERLPQVLQALQEEGHTLAVAANSGLFRGEDLEAALEAKGLKQYFSHRLYSDQEGTTKPNPALLAKAKHRSGLTEGVHHGTRPSDREAALGARLAFAPVSTPEGLVARLVVHGEAPGGPRTLQVA